MSDDVPGDDVPVYDEDDPEGPRRKWTERPTHRNIEDLGEDELA